MTAVPARSERAIASVWSKSGNPGLGFLKYTFEALDESLPIPLRV